MKNLILAVSLLLTSPTAFSAEYVLERTADSSDSCLDFLFGIGGSTQRSVTTVDVIGNPGGVALGFDAGEVGDLSGLKTDFEVIAPGVFEVFTSETDGNRVGTRLSTGHGYVRWSVELEEGSDGFVLTSTSREGFGLGAKTVSSCRLTRR